MTEEQWLTCATPGPMLSHLALPRSIRALEFFALHCCRLAWPAMTDERSRAAVEVEERFMTGRATSAERLTAWAAANEARQDAIVTRNATLADPATRPRSMSASLAAHVAYHAAASGYYDGLVTHIRDALAFASLCNDEEREALLGRMSALLRELVGNPFRPAAFSHDWRTDTTVSLAREMYATGDFSPMPILADALQDAGCDSVVILTHCRDPHAAHVRGCWVVELLLGKG